MRSAVRRQAIAGLAVAALLGAFATWLLVGAGWKAAREASAERQATITAQALTQLLAGAGDDGDAVRRVVDGMTGSDASIRSARVVLIGESQLVASTDPADVGELAAPRRLRNPEEKPLYDQAQRLRSAVTSNLEDQAAIDPEVEVERGSDKVLVVAAPLERDGAVVGIVRLEVAPPVEAAPGAPILPGLLAAAAAILLLVAVVGVLPERRLIISGVALALLAAALVTQIMAGARTLAAQRGAVERAVAAHLSAQATRAEAIPGGVSSGAALAPESWDVDAFRRPHGLVSRAGVDQVRLGEATAATLASFRAAVWVVGLGVAVVLLYFATGLASRTAQVIRANATAYGYVLPAMLVMIVLVFFPFGYGVVLSFTGSTIYNMDKSIPAIWVGLENFKEVIGNVAVAKKTDLAASFDGAASGAEGCAEERDGEWVWADCGAPEALAVTVTGRQRGALEAELVQDGAARTVTVNGPSPRHVIDYQNFYWTLWVTIAWTVFNVAIGVSVGLMLALILNTKGLKLRQVYRVLLILPWAVPNYITALIWKGMFHQQFGVVNQFLQMLGAEPVSWFEKPLTSFLACLATNAWLSFPFMMVISLGALQSIPSDLYEAARVDGATRFQQFRHITLPSLKPALVPAVILSVVWTFNMFNIIYLVSAGEPAHSTEILVTQAYKLAFEQYRYGYAAAYSTVIFLILLAYGTWQNRVTRATEGI